MSSDKIIEISCNVFVKFKTTELGEDVIDGIPVEQRPIKTSDGYYTIQLHRLFDIFGERRYSGFDTPFQDNRIYICVDN